MTDAPARDPPRAGIRTHTPSDNRGDIVMRWYEIVFGVVAVVLWYAWPILADDLAALLARSRPRRAPGAGAAAAPRPDWSAGDDHAE